MVDLIIRARRNRYLLLVMLVLVVGALMYAGYWWYYSRFRVVSHNAFITGNLIPVDADATGIVTQVLVEESQYVNSGESLFLRKLFWASLPNKRQKSRDR
jgi:membrane fusion protein (multidrug efflux system)